MPLKIWAKLKPLFGEFGIEWSSSAPRNPMDGMTQGELVAMLREGKALRARARRQGDERAEAFYTSALGIAKSRLEALDLRAE